MPDHSAHDPGVLENFGPMRDGGCFSYGVIQRGCLYKSYAKKIDVETINVVLEFHFDEVMKQ